jgi:nuclear pore complex protein Nup160
MSTRDFEILYKEARLNLEPSSASTVVQILVAPQSSSYRSNGARPSSNPADEEKAYRAKNLATASSIYYRKHHASPRGILWRVLENDTVLSLRAADVCRQEKDAEAPLVLNLRFPSPIRAPCIGFADPEGHDALCVYVVDTANQLYSITLRQDHFKKRTTNDGGALGDAVRVWSPPGFGFKHPHRLAVVNPDQLIVTMHDGGILRFDRNRSHDGRALVWILWFEHWANWLQRRRGRSGRRRYTTLRDGAKVCVGWCLSAGARRFDMTRSTWRRPLQHRRP